MKEKLKFRILFCLLSLTSLTFTSCVKQSDCDCGLTGQFIYLDEPYFTGPEFFKPDTKIVAHLIINKDIYPIFGYIPKQYRNLDTINVNTCLEVTSEPRDVYSHQSLRSIFSLKCIEKVK